MNRRELFKFGALGALATLNLNSKVLAETLKVETNAQKLKPKKLNKGDKVALIAPATAVTDPWQIANAKANLERFGLEVVLGSHLKKGLGYKTRPSDERIDDLHSAFKNPEIKAVICIRGGYGSMTILDKIDFEIIKNNPKIFIGYSDITAMHLAFNKSVGLNTFHGPVGNSSYTQTTSQYFQKALFSDEPIGKIDMSDGGGIIKTMNTGKAEGELIGGNLSLICSMMGTPFEIETKDKILFIEDVGEEPYRIDRMLAQLELSGKLSQAKGIIFGEFKDCRPSDYQPSNVWDYTLAEVLTTKTENLKIPVVYGMMIGHTSNQITLPIGAKAVLDADSKTLDILEAACG